MAPSSLFPNIVLFFYSIFILQSLSGITNAANHDFSIRIIHRDSPLSPLYNGSITAQDRLQAAAQRSISRLSYIHSPTQRNNTSSSSTIVPPNDGEYTLNFSLGSTPTQTHAFIDTSSGHIGVQCSQNGTRSSDKFLFQDFMSNFVDVGYLNFTCSSNSSWNFVGAFGLSQGPLSLVSQLGIKNFSYCIVTPNNEGLGSIMNFGSEAVNSGGQTPIVQGDDRFYYINLNGISVGDRNVPLPDGVFNKTSEGEGGFIIDSGTMYTLLRSEAYDVLVKALGEATNLPKRTGPSNLFELCFEGSFEDLDDAAPDVSFVFDNAEFMLTKQTTYVEAEEGLWCLAMVRSNEKLSILGSTQQQNYFVGYDLDHQVVSFAPVDCSIF